jgi:putative transposase
VEGGIHHVFARAVHAQDLFVDDVDRRRYLALLASAVSRHGWRCLQFCLMSNHVHLLLETPEPNLGAGMQRMHGDYGRVFNRRHGRAGHVFQGRYGSVLIDDDAQLWTVAAYIAANPVDAGLCRAPQDWPWSSDRAVSGAEEAPPWLDVERLLGHVGGGGGDPRERYARHVADRRAA